MKFVVAILVLDCALNVISLDIEQRCKINDDKCLLRVANEILTKSSKGDPSISLPSLDPLHIEKLWVTQDLNSVKVDGGLFNATFSGFSKSKILKFSISPEGNVELRVMIPAGAYDGPYSIEAYLLKLKIKGKGIVKTSVKNMEIIFKFTLEKFANEEDGKTYYRGVAPWMTFSVTGGSAHLSHLSSIANSIINWSFVVVFNAVRETLSKPLSKVYLSKINAMLTNVPIDELFLEDE